MKALGRGAITRLASRAAPGASAVPGAVYSREDWNSGRDLTSEERRCGVLTRLSTAAPIAAVARAQTSDAQVSERDASGHGAFLERAPKGRWRKISRAKTMLVEDSATPFSDPDKGFSPRVQSYGEYVRRIGKLPEGRPALRFVLFRDGYSLESVRNRLRYELGVPADAVYLHEAPGGSFGAITQFGLAVGVTREQLPHAARHYNVHPLIFDDRGYHGLEELPRLTAAPQAHLHRLLLRCVDGDEAAVAERLRHLSANGFVNYFGVETFGVGGNRLFDLAAFYHRGEPRLAVGGYLQTLAESSPLHHQPYLAYVNAEEGTVAGAVEEWLRLCERAKEPGQRRAVLRRLHRYHLSANTSGSAPAVSMQDVWESCAATQAAESSAAAFVWNAMASQRLLTYGTRPVKGDLVQRTGVDGEVQVAELRSDAEAAECDIENVVLPVPHRPTSAGAAPFRYPSHAVSESLYTAFAKQHSLSFLFTPPPSCAVEVAPSHPLYRRLVRRPQHLQAAVLRDPSSCAALKNDLFVMQQHQATESWTLDYERRVREPSPFNNSERFQERMRLIGQRHPGTNSVALSFVLPAESSPWVAMREAFQLHYASFSDLYGTR